VLHSLLARHQPWFTLVGNLSNRANSHRFHRKVRTGLDLSRGETILRPESTDLQPAAAAVGL